MSLVTRISSFVSAVAADIKQINTTLANKVDKAVGKALSTNDLTDLLKTQFQAAYQYIQDFASGGFVSGGVLTPTSPSTSTAFTISAGVGWARKPDGEKVKVSWNEVSSACSFDGGNFIGIDYNGNVIISNQFISHDHIPIAFVQTALGNAIITGYSNVKFQLTDVFNNINDWVRSAVGVLVGSGCNISMQPSPNQFKLTLGSGVLYYQFNKFLINDTSTFTRLFNSQQGYIPETTFPANTIPVGYYNDVTENYLTALKPMTAGYFTKHLLFINPEGLLFMLYGDAEYATYDEARAAPEPAAPASISASICRVAAVIIEEGNTTSVAGLLDIRPIFYRLFMTGVSATPLTVVNHHDLVGNPDGDDHPQYVNITRGDIRYLRRTEADVYFALTAPLDSPALTGIPTVPTASLGTNTTQIANTQFVVSEITAAIANLIASSPGTLDTLYELATALGNDPDFAGTVTTALGNRLRIDASQSLSAGQQLQGRQNLNIVDTSVLSDSPNKRLISDVLLGILQVTSGTNTGDETNSSIKSKLGFATALVDGYLTSIDWNTFNNKASLASPTFTGNPACPTQTAGTANTTLANTLFVATAITNAISNLVGGAPGALDTLNELATALGSDPNFATTISTALSKRVRVDAVQSFTGGEQSQARQNIGVDSTANQTDSVNKRFITDAQRTVLQATSGTNTGDETPTTVKTKLGVASSSTDGYLSSTDWSLFNSKAGLDSPAFTNNPTAPTQVPGTNNTTLANTQFVTSAVSTAVSALVASSPAALDTLNELASALGNDANFSSTISTALGNRLRIDAAQSLTSGQQLQGRQNLNIIDTSVLADSLDKRFVTDALLAIISAISGTNTGDETQTSILTKIGTNAITNAMLSQVLSGTIKGRSAAGTGPEEDLTMTKLASMMAAGMWWRDEDFPQGSTPANWATAVSGAGASVTYPQQAGSIGNALLSTGTTATGWAVLHDIGTTSKFLAGSGELVTIIKFQLAALSTAAQTYVLRMGFGDANNSADYVDSGGYIEYTHTVNGGNFVFCTANNSTRTKSNSSVAATAKTGDNWDYLKVVTNAAGTQSDIYINNVLLGSITTNIPVAAGRAFDISMAIIKTVGTTAATLRVDRVWEHFVRTDAANANWRI